MTDYSYLPMIDSKVLNIARGDENYKLMWGNESFVDIYQLILDLTKGESLEFWREHPELVDYLDSQFVRYYYAIRVKRENIDTWVNRKDKVMMEYSFVHHYDFSAMQYYQNEISELFGDKWVAHKVIESIEDLRNLVNYPNLKMITVMQTIPFEHFPMIPGLKYMNIKQCAYTSLANFPVFPELTHLRVEYCQLSTLENFPVLPRLTHLFLAHNHITTFQGLVFFDVSSNQIASFEHLPAFETLIYLDVANNRLSTFEHLPAFPRLETLRIFYNEFTTFEHFPAFPRLARLQAFNNKLTTLKHLPALETLTNISVSYNNLDSTDVLEDKTMFPKLTFSQTWDA